MESAYASLIHGTLGLVVMGIVGWAIRLEARMSVMERVPESMKELFNSKFAALEKQMSEIHTLLLTALRIK